jgi:hypothetical protein
MRFAGWSGADGELFLRADSVMDLATSFHELAALAERHVTDLDKLSAVDAAARSRAAQMLPAELRDTANHLFTALTGGFQQELKAHLDALDPGTVGAIRDPFEWVLAQLTGLFGQGIDTAQGALAELPVPDPRLFGYMMQLGLASERRPRLISIRRALLITAVANAEAVIRGVLHRLVFTRDGGSWDLPAHDAKAGRLMRGGIESWQQNLRDQGYGLDLASATCDWPAVKELWARRHALVHNAGIADQNYVRRVPGATAGAILDVDSTYLSNALDLVCGFLLGFIVTAWVTISPGNREFVLRLALAYGASAEGEQHWPIAETLYLLAARLDDDPGGAAVHQVNSWLTRVRWRGPQSVHADASRWQTAKLPARFQLAREILLGHRGEAVAMLPSLTEQGEISRTDLTTWPLFDSIRDDPAVQLLQQG